MVLIESSSRNPTTQDRVRACVCSQHYFTNHSVWHVWLNRFFSVNLFKPIISNLSVEKVGENVQIHLEIQQTKLFSSDSDQKDTLIKDLSTTFPLSMILCNWIAFVHFCVSLTLFALLCSPTLCIFRHVLCALQPCARCQCTGDVQRWMRAPPV